jgi:hypothetical protein
MHTVPGPAVVDEPIAVEIRQRPRQQGIDRIGVRIRRRDTCPMHAMAAHAPVVGSRTSVWALQTVAVVARPGPETSGRCGRTVPRPAHRCPRASGLCASNVASVTRPQSCSAPPPPCPTARRRLFTTCFQRGLVLARSFVALLVVAPSSAVRAAATTTYRSPCPRGGVVVCAAGGPEFSVSKIRGQHCPAAIGELTDASRRRGNVNATLGRGG